MLKRLLLSSLPLIVIIALPLIFRKSSEKIDLSADQLVIVSPHNEAIRYEFEQGFRAYYEKLTGRKVSIDWRATGGTSEIARYVSSAYEAVFRDYWVNTLKQPWSDQVAMAFMNRKPGVTALPVSQQPDQAVLFATDRQELIHVHSSCCYLLPLLPRGSGS